MNITEKKSRLKLLIKISLQYDNYFTKKKIKQFNQEEIKWDCFTKRQDSAPKVGDIEK